MNTPKRVGHVVLNVSNLEASTKFYTEVLGFEISRQADFGTFLTCGKIHHDIALFQAPEGAQPVSQSQVGLNHVAIQVEDMDTLKAFYQRFKEYGVTLDHLTDHGMTSSVYFYDLDGIRLEFFCNTTATAAEGLAIMRSPGPKNRELVLEDVPA
ncbi:Biphenyl-2,3-diol 1,2-dioxygenase 2 [Candidatus Entotheonellaceae bacterium PAL068K]